TRSPPPERAGSPRRECSRVPPTRPAETPAPPSRPPTLAHVAQLAGVSPATASRVLNGSARVSRAARLRVEAAAERLGYVRRRPGSPGRVSSGTIAAVVCEDACRVLGDPYFARLLWGVRRELAGRAPLVVLMAGRADEWRAGGGCRRRGGGGGGPRLRRPRLHGGPPGPGG